MKPKGIFEKYAEEPFNAARAMMTSLDMSGLLRQGGFMAMQTLWAGPWMVRVLGLSLDQNSQVLFLFNFTLLLSYLVLSWWAPRYVSFNNKPGIPVLQAVSIGLAGAVIVQALMVFYVTSWNWILWVPFAILVTVTTLAQMHVSLAFPPQQAGRANSAFNLTLFIGAFSIQWGIGLLIDLFMLQGWSQSDAMRLSWGLYVLLQLAVLIVFVKSRAESISA